MKIFLDVGAYKGETLGVAMEEKYAFDKLYCFEPVPEKCVLLRKVADDRVEVFEYGLWNKTRVRKLYNPSRRGASLFKDKNPNLKDDSLDIKLVRASEWFNKNLNANDDVYLKLNCEGAEWTILDNLIKSGEYKKIKVLMVDFDIRKIPSQKHLMNEMKERLRKLDIPKMYFVDEYNLGRGSGLTFTYFWLDNSIINK